MNELERLRRRRHSWAVCQGPGWLLKERARIIRELDAEIARLEAEERVARDGTA